MEPDRRLRVLLLAEQCNPEWPSLPIVGYKYALALSAYCDVVVVTQVRNESTIRKYHQTDTATLRFHFVDTEYVARPLHRFAMLLRGNPEVGWSTGMIMSYVPYVEFERHAWKTFRASLRSGEFDIVHRITPMSPTLPSWMAGRGSQPFVIGPLNGNLAWPEAYAAEQKREKEGLRRIRNLYRILPFTRRTWRHADAVLAAFQHTINDLDCVPREKILMFPEVGYDESIFYPSPDLDRSQSSVRAEKPSDDSDHEPPSAARSLTYLFAGRLVPYKLAEVAIRAFTGSNLLREGHRLRIVGDGPERSRLEQMVEQSGATDSVIFEGRLDQAGVASVMRGSDVFVFPSIRELGAGVVVEAMACGLLCLVVDYGGPADLVAADRGCKVPLAPIDELTESFRYEMEKCARAAGTPSQHDLRRTAAAYASDNFRWTRKAALTEELYRRLQEGQPAVPTLSSVRQRTDGGLR